MFCDNLTSEIKLKQNKRQENKFSTSYRLNISTLNHVMNFWFVHLMVTTRQCLLLGKLFP